MELFRLFATLGLKADEFNKGVDQAENRGSAMGAKLKKGFLAIGAAAVTMGGLALRAGMELEDSMRGISAQTGMTEEEVKKVEHAIRDLALEQGRFTAAEMAAGLQSVSRHGQDSEHQMNMLESAMRLADATGNDFGSSINYLDQLMVKFGKETLDGATQFTNMFATAQGVAGVAMGSLTDGLQRAAGITNMAGLEYDFVAASLTRAYQEGMSMQVAATGLTNIFGDMTDVTSNMRGVMDDLGIQIAINDDGSRDYQGALSDLTAALRNLDYDTRQATMAQLGLSGGALSLFDIFKNNYQYVDNLSESFRDGIEAGDEYWRVMEMVDSRTGGIGEQFTRLRNTLTEAKLAMFDVINVPFGQTMGSFNDTIQQLVRAALPPLQAGLRGVISVLGGLLSVASTLMPVIVGLTAAFVAWKATLAVQAAISKVTTAVEAAKKAKVTLTIANNALGVSNLKVSKGTKLLSAAMVFFESKTKLATLAVLKKNLAMKATPVGLVIAGVAALAAGIAFLATRTARQTEEQIRLNEETRKLREETDNLTDSIRTSADAHADSVQNIEAEIGANRRLLDELRESKAAYDGSVESRARIAASVQSLNESMGDLNLQYDKETGLLNKTIDSIEELIETRAEQARAAAAQARSVEIAREQIIVEENLARAIALKEEMEAAGYATTEKRIRQADGSMRTIEVHTEAYEEQLAVIADLEAQQYELADSFEFVTEIMVESNEAIIESTEEVNSAFETAKEVYGEFSEQAIAAFEAAVESGEIWCEETIANYREAAAAATEHSEQHTAAMEALGAEYERVRDRASDAFGVMSENVSVSMAQATANIEENTRLITEQAENTATAMTRAMEKGVDEGVLRKMEEMADRGPGYAAMLANASDEEFAGLIEAWGASAEAAVDAVATRFGADEDVVREAANLAESTTESLRSQLEAADISQMGDNVTQSLIDGIAAKIPNAENVAQRLGISVVDLARRSLGISSPSRPFTQFGENLPTSLGRGITRLISAATGPSTNMASGVLNAARNILTASVFDGIAATIINSLASGITNRTHIVVTAITRMAEAAVAAAHAALQISSPSKLFDDMGDNVTKSFANRVLANKSLVANAMDDVFGDLDRTATASMRLDHATPAVAVAAAHDSISHGGGDIIIKQDFSGRELSPYEAKVQMLAGARQLRWIMPKGKK